MTDFIIRKESSKDQIGITKVNDRAFGQKQEGLLVENLRKKKEFISELSLVAILDNIIVGHILFYPVSIISGTLEVITLSLGPVAVLPEFRNKGIGGELIREGLNKARELGFGSVVVLGHPDYYPKFGFRKSSEWKIKDPFGAPEEAMMALELENGSLGFGGGLINYPKEFYDAV